MPFGQYVSVVLLAAVGLGCLSSTPFPVGLASTARAQDTTLVSLDPSGTLDITGLEQQFAAVAEQIGPSVVAISATGTAVDADDALRSDNLSSERLSGMLDRTTRTVGTGFVIDAGGYILTNEHVIGDAEQLWVTTDSKMVYPAIVVGSDPRMDLAVLKVPANLPPVKFAADPVRRGQWTIALGNPYGLATAGEMCMSVGVVSATDRSLTKLATKENRLYTNLIQTTAQINPGNSGGPLFNLRGEVIGVNTAVILPQKQTNGIGFAMPITPRLLDRVSQLKEGQEVVYGYMGVMVSLPTPRQRRTASLDKAIGVNIDSFEKGTPADGVLQKDDLIVSINGETINDCDHFVSVVGSARVDRLARVDLYRDGKPMTVEMQLRQRQLPSVAVHRENQRFRWRGMLLGPIPANWDFGGTPRPQAGLMVLAVADNSPAIAQGITAGTIITAVAGKTVAAINDLQAIINDTPEEHCSIELATMTNTIVSIRE